VISRTAIDAAKQRLDIPTLWRLLELPGKPRKICRSPFRQDKHPSFSIFDQGRAAKDHATGQCYDGPSFLAAARSLSDGEALKEFVKMAGGELSDCQPVSSRKQTDEPVSETTRTKPDLSKFRSPSPREIRAVAHDRDLDLAAPEIAKRLGCLKIGEVCGHHSWILTDPAGWNAEARRFGRKLYPDCGQLSERKAHTIRHSTKSWPVGLGVDRSLVEKATLIAIVEGSADYLAAWHFIYQTKSWNVLPVAILGRAIHGLHPHALELLKGKRIRFFPHADRDDGALEQISIIGDQLRTIGCQPTFFDLRGLHTRVGALVKDLNDLARLDPSQSEELHDLFFCNP
jgi:hypothetical protein